MSDQLDPKSKSLRDIERLSDPIVRRAETPRECRHSRTEMWEPHLAGARKCKDCGMVYNPNMGGWHHEDSFICDYDAVVKERDRYREALALIAKQPKRNEPHEEDEVYEPYDPVFAEAYDMIIGDAREALKGES